MLKPRALTLLETMLALGILLTGMIGILSLFQAGLQHSRRSEQQLRLTFAGRELLRQRLNSLRDGAAFHALTAAAGGWQAEPAFAGLESRWIVTQQSLYSPGESLEQAFPLTNQKVLRSSAKRIELQLRAPEGLGFTTVSLLATATEPLRQWAASQPVRLQSTGSNPLAVAQTLTFTVTCQAEDGRQLEDVVVAWSVIPVDGVGTLESVSRDGRQATFRNQTRRKNGAIKYSGGSCYVLAQASYAGQIREVRSPLIQLVAP